jgi:hypothetical protein
MAVHDVDLFGKLDAAGNPIELFDDDAIGNALKIWLGSRNSDYIKNSSGGPLEKVNFKNLSIANKDRLTFQITNAIENAFSPSIFLEYVNVRPNYEMRAWEIDVAYRTRRRQEASRVVTVITRESIIDRRRNFTYVDVEYAGQNLTEFVLVQQVNQPGERLKFDASLDAWVWGKFKLINLTNKSDNFGQILQIING